MEIFKLFEDFGIFFMFQGIGWPCPIVLEIEAIYFAAGKPWDNVGNLKGAVKHN